ncbi:hypothetical protein [Hydrogenophaga sp.]|uniref:hypothetical protein n=1 Tax=Hydrogenophaga sp. TaxID=1904254 RepID=UPI003D0E6482
MEAEINSAIGQVHALGYCAASWQPEVVAVSTPLITPEGVFVLNASVSTEEAPSKVVRSLSKPLLALSADILSCLSRLEEP